MRGKGRGVADDPKRAVESAAALTQHGILALYDRGGVADFSGWSAEKLFAVTPDALDDPTTTYAPHGFPGNLVVKHRRQVTGENSQRPLLCMTSRRVVGCVG